MYNSDIRDNIKDITGKSFRQIVDLLTVEQAAQLKNYMRDELVQRGLNVNKRNIRFDEFVKDLLDLQKKANNTDDTPKVAPEQIKRDYFREILRHLKEKAPKLTDYPTEKDFISAMVQYINVPSSKKEILEAAKALSKEMIEKANDEKAAAERKVEEATKKANEAESLKEKAKEELEKAKENHRSAILSLKDSFRKEKESLTDTYKKDMQKMKDEHDAKITALNDTHSKEVEELRFRYQHEIVKQKEKYYRLEKELKRKDDELTCLKHQHCEELKEAQDIVIKIIQMVRDNIATAYDSSNKDIKRLIDKEIINNRIYSLDYFIEKGSTGKKMLRDAFQECLSEDFPTWLDVLTRLYCYIQVPFLSERFLHAGIDRSKVIIAFQIICQMLKQMKMDLIYPHLFMEEFNEGTHIAYQYGTSIISYLPDADIDIKKLAKPNMIVDMRSVGFCMDGEIKKLPSVIVFHRIVIN